MKGTGKLEINATKFETNETIWFSMPHQGSAFLKQRYNYSTCIPKFAAAQGEGAKETASNVSDEK